MKKKQIEIPQSLYNEIEKDAKAGFRSVNKQIHLDLVEVYKRRGREV